QKYVRDSVTIGAFATDLQLSRFSRPRDQGTSGLTSPIIDRLFVPARGDASLTWVDVTPDDPSQVPVEGDTSASYAPFFLGCNRGVGAVCDDAYQAGIVSGDSPRGLTAPGEPFGIDQSADGSVLVMTHQATQQVSLFDTGMGVRGVGDSPKPTLLF